MAGSAPAWVWSIVRIAVLAWAGLCALLWLMQDRLIFHPMAPDLGASERLRAAGAEAVRLEAPGGAALHGWVHGDRAEDGIAILYFGGNAEEVASSAIDIAARSGRRVALFNYRGFALSEGEPSEAALMDDALLAFDHLAARPDFGSAGIVVMGRSLGSGVAVHVASERAVAGVVLVSPYDSIAAVAQARYPMVPVRWLLRHPFDSASRAPSVSHPALLLAHAADQVVPAANSEALFEAWGGPKQWVLLAHGDHATLENDPAYWSSIRTFVASLGAR